MSSDKYKFKYKLLFLLISITLIRSTTTVHSQNMIKEHNHKQTKFQVYSEDLIENNSENITNYQNNNASNNELYYLFIGAFLSLLGSIVFALLNKLSNKIGDFKIYTKVVYSKIDNSTAMQVKNNSLHIPIWVEFINTKNETIIIRDFNIAIYNNNEFINKMTQINFINKDSEKIVLANNGSYTFIIPPRSAVKYDLYFTLKYNASPRDFNNLKIIYHNNKDKIHTINFKNFAAGWNSNIIIKDKDWNRLI